MFQKNTCKKILSKIEEAKKLGAKILIGGERQILDGDLKEGYYVQPTIIEGLTYDCHVNQEEILKIVPNAQISEPLAALTTAEICVMLVDHEEFDLIDK